jgi:hypothetical protein
MKLGSGETEFGSGSTRNRRWILGWNKWYMRKSSNKCSNITCALPRLGKVEELAANEKRRKIDFEKNGNAARPPAVLPLIAHLEQENADLRQKLVDLMLQIHEFRGQRLPRR